jgi:amino acid transporter
MEQSELKRGLGMWGAAGLIFGYVVGASIYVLIGSLAAKTGPGLWLAYLIATVPAVFVCFTSAQLGSVLPITGANYVITSRAIGPFWGFATVWSVILLTATAVPLIAYGIAEYLNYYFQGVPIMATAITVTLLFGVINMIGIGFTGWVQNIMVLAMIVALFVFGIGGSLHPNPAHIMPLMPNGFSPIMMAAITGYFSYTGFIVLVDLGGEIKRPSRNIPRALMIALIAVTITYLLQTFALTNVLDWRMITTSLDAVKKDPTLIYSTTAIITASEMLFPKWVVVFIYIGAIFAALTSINGILAANPRDIYALAKDRVFPGWLAWTSKRFKTPYMAIAGLTLLSVAGIIVGRTIEQYAFLVVMGLMSITIVINIGILRIKKKLPLHYEKSPFKLKGFWFWFFPIGSIVISGIYVLLGILTEPVAVGIFLAIQALGCLFYFERKWRLKKNGVDIVNIFEKDLDGVLKRAREVE